MAKGWVLVTNDDGTGSHFLRAMAEALARDYDVAVVAPAGERSWIGRGVSRHGRVEVQPVEGFPGPAWMVDGTPTDCVNIGLHHLLPERPIAVASGINIGMNVCLPMILASGTVAGALEGSLSGLPAVAFSKAVPRERFRQIRGSDGYLEGEDLASLRSDCDRIPGMLAAWVAQRRTGGVVLNINFPPLSTAATPVRPAPVCQLRLGSLFQLQQDERFSFEFPGGERLNPQIWTDADCIDEGLIGRTELDFSQLGATQPLQ